MDFFILSHFFRSVALYFVHKRARIKKLATEGEKKKYTHKLSTKSINKSRWKKKTPSSQEKKPRKKKKCL